MVSEPIVERFRRARRDPDLVVLEGFHAVKHAARFGAEILEVMTSDADAAERLAEELAPDVRGALKKASSVDAATFARLAPRPHPTGVIALARRPSIQLKELLESADSAPVVVLEGSRRPENVGAVVRVAAAVGAGGVIALGGVDPWGPGAVRGGAGLQFALPVARVAELDALEGDRPLVAFAPDGVPLAAGAIPPRALLAFGTERSGLSPEILARADRRLAIPMQPGVSSLNLATAAAVALYAWRLTPG